MGCGWGYRPLTPGIDTMYQYQSVVTVRDANEYRCRVSVHFVGLGAGTSAKSEEDGRLYTATVVSMKSLVCPRVRQSTRCGVGVFEEIYCGRGGGGRLGPTSPD